MKKKFLFIFLFFIFMHPVKIFAAIPYVLYEQKQENLITKNLTYYAYKQITTEGMRDFYVLKVPLDDPNITVKSVESLKDYGLKETVKSLIADNKAIAGVNGDFFGIKGKYSAPFGIVVNDGNLISLNSNINASKPEYASFIIDNNNNPFMAYVKSEINFLNDGKKNITVSSINKITDMVFPVYIDRNAMINTKSLDERFPDLVKILVANDKIIYISEKGETVDIPQNGYIIAMNSNLADFHLKNFSVGQNAEFTVKSSVDLDNIKTMFGGVGQILTNGKITNDNVVLKGRQPRTALGLTYDRKTLIIILVDGRTHSIGATNEETAILMKRFGAYNAMNLDGGGSSTMVIKNFASDSFDIVNTLSDGLQRNVINAVGVFKPQEMGQINSIKIVAKNNDVINGLPVKIKVFGLDEYLNKIEIPAEIISDDPDGKFDGEYFYPARIGKIKLTAQYENFTDELEINADQINILEPAQKKFNLQINRSCELSVNAIRNDGKKIKLNDINYEIAPNDLGKIENNKFTALKPGYGYIKCFYANFYCYIEIFVEPAPQKIDLNNIKFTYKFEDKNQTKELEFKNPIELGNPSKLIFNIDADKSQAALKALLTNENGDNLIFDLAKKIDWECQKNITIDISGKNLKLKKIYVIATENSDSNTHNFCLTSLKGIFTDGLQKTNVPQNKSFSDKLNVDFNDVENSQESFDIFCFGNLSANTNKKSDNYKENLDKVLAPYKKDSLGLFVENFDENLDGNIFKQQNNYFVNTYKNICVVNMMAEKGCLFKTNIKQWQNLENDVKNNNSDHVIIILDKNPASFVPNKEYEIFHDLLKTFVNNGKNVFVLFSCAENDFVNVKDGVRYINIGSLYKKDLSLNQNYKSLKFRVTNKNIAYKFICCN